MAQYTIINRNAERTARGRANVRENPEDNDKLWLKNSGNDG